MAKLQIITLEEGNTFSAWFNGINGSPLGSGEYFDASDWANYFNQQAQKEGSNETANAGWWQISKNKIQAGNYTWRGNFQIEGDRVIGGYVTGYERDFGSEHIKITDFKYPAVGSKTAGAFTTFTLPEAITDYFESPSAHYDHYGNAIPIKDTEEFRSLKQGMSYTFETIYDTKNKKHGANKPEATEHKLITKIDAPTTFEIKGIDRLTNFNPSTDSLEINTDSFGIDSSATFASGKNRKVVKKKLAKQDFDFLYDQKKGGLYFNENSADKGFGDGGIIAILKGAPELTASHLEFI